MSSYRSGRHYNHRSHQRSTSSQDFIMKDLETDNPLKTFTKPHFGQNKAGSVITDVRPLASYSWHKSNIPTIIVPGSPPIWARDPTTVAPDRGTAFVDENAARMGRSASPLLPLFVALEEMGNEEHVLSDHDIITDRNNLRKLLRWVSGGGGGAKSGFRIDIQLSGTTLLFTRRDEKNKIYFNGNFGYGHSYENASTNLPKGCENASGHHRIVSFKFGSIRTLLRFEVDACTGMEGVAENLAPLPTTSSVTKTKTTGGIRIIRSYNKMPPQSELMELKTRSERKGILDWREVYPQLYLSQTPILVEAVHNFGSFRRPVRYALNDLVSTHTCDDSFDLDSAARKETCSMSKMHMAQLHELLKHIVDAVKAYEEGVPMALVGTGSSLILYERKNRSGCDIVSEVLTLFK